MRRVVPPEACKRFLPPESQKELKSHGIACEIRGSRPSPLSNRPWAELWILDASETGQARQIVQAALESDQEENIDRGLEADDEPPQVSPSWTWTCPHCSGDVETQFSECWNCRSERPDQQLRVTGLPEDLTEK